MTQSYSTDRLELQGLRGIPLINSGDDLGEVLALALIENGISLQSNDVLVIAQKVVSKAEGRLIELNEVAPSDRARQLAAETEKDARFVELILRESNEVLRHVNNLIITEHRLGFVMANAGVDQSNVQEGTALLLPLDPDASAAQLRRDFENRLGVKCGVVIADSIGRAWRNGIVGHAIGVAGIQALMDLRQTRDLHDRELRVTEVALADEMASAATLIMGQGAEGIPAVLIRGFGPFVSASNAAALIRDKSRDLFR